MTERGAEDGPGRGSPKSDVAEAGSPGGEPSGVVVWEPAMEREDALPQDIKDRYPCMVPCLEVKVSKCYCTICNEEVKRKTILQHCSSKDHRERERLLDSAINCPSFEVRHS